MCCPVRWRWRWRDRWALLGVDYGVVCWVADRLWLSMVLALVEASGWRRIVRASVLEVILMGGMWGWGDRVAGTGAGRPCCCQVAVARESAWGAWDCTPVGCPGGCWGPLSARWWLGGAEVMGEGLPEGAVVGAVGHDLTEGMDGVVAVPAGFCAVLLRGLPGQVAVLAVLDVQLAPAAIPVWVGAGDGSQQQAAGGGAQVVQ